MPSAVAAYPPRNLAQLRPQTRPERAGFTETSAYADVQAFIDSLRHINTTLPRIVERITSPLAPAR